MSRNKKDPLKDLPVIEEIDAIFMAMTDAVLLFDTKAGIVKGNQAAVSAYGFDPAGMSLEELSSKICICYRDGNKVPQENLPVARALKGEIVQSEEFIYTNLDEKKFISMASASPIIRNGILRGAVLVWHDITDRERLLEQLTAERAWLSTIIASAPGAIVLADEQGNIIKSNPAADRLYTHALPRHGAVSDSLTPQTTGSIPHSLEEILSRSAQFGETQVNREVAVSWSNEQQRYLLVNSTPIFDRHGKIRGAVGVFQDITQRKQVEQAALEKERRIAEILNSITDCYYGLDTQWRITEMNPNGLAYYGFSRQDVIGRYIWDVFPVYRKSEIEANYLRAVTSGLPAHFEMHSLVVDRWAEFHAYPSQAGLSVYFRDISERKKAEEQLRQAKDELEIRVQERTHELKQLNEELHSEIHERVLAESALNKIKQDLEQRVEQRTAELQKVNLDLSYELAEGERAEKERELLLEQLENERQRWQATVESMLDPVTVCDSQGRSIYMNAAYSEMVNRTINADISLDDQAQFYQLYHPDGSLFQPGDLPLQKAALEDVEVRNVEIVQRASTGEEHVTVWNAAALHDRNGQVSGAVAVGRDITRQRQAEAALISYAKKLEQSNRDLEDFAFIASHDLQEPLRKIHAFGSRLKEKASQRLGPDELDFLDRMMKASTRMTTMINDLLAYSRVTTKARPHEKVDLTEVAEEVLSDLEFHIERTKGQVDIAALPVLEADRAQMRALFQNLIGNALKFHREGVAPVIHVYSEGAERTASSGVKIYIADNGIGFDERYLSRLFQPFQRLHGRSEYEGSGIGLAICRKIVARHGGSITARSQPGNGSTFIITLPLVQIKGSRQDEKSAAT